MCSDICIYIYLMSIYGNIIIITNIISYFMNKNITIKTEFIRLGDLLKFANIASSGGEAKVMVTLGLCTVNGEPCTMRGKKLRNGDVVDVAGTADREPVQLTVAGPAEGNDN